MHAPSHLREALQEYLDSDTSAQAIRVEHDGEEKGLDWLLGKLWHCTDILPAGYCDRLDIPKGSTYAQAVRRMKENQEFYL